MTTLREAERFIAEVVALHPDAEIERNRVGNIVFLDGEGEPLGYIDPFMQEWQYF